MSDTLLADVRSAEGVTSFLDEAIKTSKDFETQSPLKLAIRRADRHNLHQSNSCEYVETYFQRMVYHFPHVIDYICLFMVKRVATGQPIDRDGWAEVINSGVLRHMVLGHHHEACWLFWLGIVCGLSISGKIIEELPKHNNHHLTALAIQAFIDGKISRPPIRFGTKISSDDRSWLPNLVARSTALTRAAFFGCYVDECEHLAKRALRLVNFDAHIKRVADAQVRAISNVRFGYEDEDDSDLDRRTSSMT